MPTSLARNASPKTSPRKRADAERSIASILDAAVEALASDPEVSMAEIARRAGVVRATIYVHFPTREALIEAVTARAIREAVEIVKAAEPERGEPSEALARVLAATWRYLGRFHALAGINMRLPPAELRRRHRPVLAAIQPLIERGQRSGAFRSDIPASWHLSMTLALVHAATEEVRSRRLSDAEVEAALTASVLGALAGPRGQSGASRQGPIASGVRRR